jgi:hypothetical protein
VPWKPSREGEWPTLGYLVAEFIQDNCVVPDGDHAGRPYELTDEMLWFLLQFYRLDEGGKFVHRGGQLVRPQKWGKGPFSAAIVCAEAGGPVLFDGWDANGRPVGRPWATPWIQITAVSEDQTDNVWRALVPMIELGELNADIPDTGETRINLPGGGRIEPVTSSASSRLGQRITFAVQDETHSWTERNRGRKLADNQRRNLAGMNGRWLETTNAWDPAEESVAQQTAESTATDIYRDHRDCGVGSIRNKRDRAKMLKRVYGDSWWVNQERIEAEVLELLDRDPAQAERFFFNRIRAAEDAAFDLDRWNQLADPEHVVADKSVITIGVDGARWEDALAIVATEVETGHQWPLGIWEQPASAPEDYEHPFHEVDGAVTEAFERFTVWRAYIDPQNIENLLERWQGRYGDKRVIEWFTNRPKQIAHAVRAYRTAISAGDLSHDGDSRFARHIGNAKRQKLSVYDDDRRQMFTISKDRPMSPRKIDAAMAGILSWEARGDAIAAGAGVRRSSIYENRGMEMVG